MEVTCSSIDLSAGSSNLTARLSAEAEEEEFAVVIMRLCSFTCSDVWKREMMVTCCFMSVPSTMSIISLRSRACRQDQARVLCDWEAQGHAAAVISIEDAVPFPCSLVPPLSPPPLPLTKQADPNRMHTYCNCCYTHLHVPRQALKTAAFPAPPTPDPTHQNPYCWVLHRPTDTPTLRGAQEKVADIPAEAPLSDLLPFPFAPVIWPQQDTHCRCCCADLLVLGEMPQ